MVRDRRRVNLKKDSLLKIDSSSIKLPYYKFKQKIYLNNFSFSIQIKREINTTQHMTKKGKIGNKKLVNKMIETKMIRFGMLYINKIMKININKKIQRKKFEQKYNQK